MDNTAKLVSLGRFMTFHAGAFRDDLTCNSWARVGKLLTEVGVSFAPKFQQFEADDQRVALQAAKVMSGREVMPEKMQATVAEQPRRTRKARMTNVMRRDKVAAPKQPKAPVADVAPKKRGRPRKVIA